MSCHRKTFHMNIFVLLSTCCRIVPCPTFELIHLNRIIYEESFCKNSLYTTHLKQCNHVWYVHLSCWVLRRQYRDPQFNTLIVTNDSIIWPSVCENLKWRQQRTLESSRPTKKLQNLFQLFNDVITWSMLKCEMGRKRKISYSSLIAQKRSSLCTVMSWALIWSHRIRSAMIRSW